MSPRQAHRSSGWQWLPEEILNHRINLIKNTLGKNGIEVRTESVGWSLAQGVLARGDAKLSKVLANMQRNSLAAWRKALEECDLSADFYIHRELPYDEPLPWSVLDSGVTPDYLKEELKQGSSAASRPHLAHQRDAIDAAYAKR